MINRIIKFLTSMQFMTLLILLFAFSIGFATFIENDFGRSSAKSLVFSAWWFEGILMLLVFNLINNLIRFNLFRWEKIAPLIFHLAFIVILIGAGITRYVSYEGMMHIREGDSTNLFISDDTFLQIHINDGEHQYEYDKKLFLSGIINKNFHVKGNFKSHDISIKSVAFYPNVKDSLLKQNIVGISISSKNTALTSDQGTNISLDEMSQKNLDLGKNILLKDVIFTLENPINDAFNFQIKEGILECIAPKKISIMSMPPDGRGYIDYFPGTSFQIIGPTLIKLDSLKFVINPQYDGARTLFSSSNVMVDGAEDALVIDVHANGKNREVVLYGGKGYKGSEEVFALNNLNFRLSYGSKYYRTPFRVMLRDFQLERYPGSESPSSYAAEVTILDEDIVSDHRIFMNNVLNYKGYRFFQSSYDKDERGTILSVNHDWWGTLITYLGYFLLGLGFVLVFLTNNTRYKALSQKLKKLSAIIILPFILSFSAYADDSRSMIKDEKRISLNHIEKFDALVVQDNGGRFKPVHTLTSEHLRKIYGKDNFNNRSATEIILLMTYNPHDWLDKKMIKVSHPKLRALLSSSDIESRYILVSFNDLYYNDSFFKDVDLASNKSPKDRDQYDKDILKVIERFNIYFSILGGNIFRLFPVPSDFNNTWVPYTHADRFGTDSLLVSNLMGTYFLGLREGLETNDWSSADTMLYQIQMFQLKYGANVLPPKNKIDLEITYNKINVFSRLFMYYFSIGLCLLIVFIIRLFQDNKLLKVFTSLFKWMIIVGFIAHTAGLGLRWYISGHAPWSNGYESMIYIAWATILSGLIYSRRSLLTLAATAVISGIFLMVAHLNFLDPQITHLVPVLKSYWLMIHVAIITASYGFFSLGAILGLISLWIIIFTVSNNKSKLKNTLTELTIINEKALEVGLFMLAIGTFLGGVWANESWGRYWGWDPKETWALVSVLVYTFVLHMRFIPSLRNQLTFNIVSMFAIWTIIMTYFGVNYYLSGLHSYAAGDPMPIPDFVYYLLGLMFVTAIIAKLRFKKHY